MVDNNIIVQLFEHIGNMKAETSEIKANTANIMLSIHEMKNDFRSGRIADTKRMDEHDARLTVVEGKITDWKGQLRGIAFTCGITFAGLIFIFKIVGVIH